MCLCELETKMLLKKVGETGKVTAVPQFPGIKRDISLKPKEGVSDAEIRKVIKQAGGRDLTKITLFDTFKGSRAYSLEFRSTEKTLTDEEVGASFQKVVEAVKTITLDA